MVSGAVLPKLQLVDVIFKYDNVVMEEAAQILEVETFIPLLLQNPDDGYNRLKRVILIGDHNQLPPVVKNMAFQRYGNMEQSLFARFVRLGVPPVVLNAQGRARPSLAALFAWRYAGLGNLPNVEREPQYLAANTGFAFDYQVRCRRARCTRFSQRVLNANANATDGVGDGGCRHDRS